MDHTEEFQRTLNLVVLVRQRLTGLYNKLMVNEKDQTISETNLGEVLWKAIHTHDQQDKVLRSLVDFDFIGSAPQATTKSKWGIKNKIRFFSGILFINALIITILTIGLINRTKIISYIYKFFINQDNVVEVEPEIIATPTPKPTPTPQPTNYQDYKILILNGSGIPGEAGRARDKLEEENIEVGNAEAFESGKSTISTNNSVPNALVQKIQQDLPEYEFRINQELEHSEYEVVITLRQ